MGTEAETASSAGAGHAPREDASADRRARLAACLERARAGEIGALDDVVTELNPLLWHVARAEGLTVDDAVDVVQTAWLELLRRIHEIRSTQALTAWLVTTVRRGAWRSNRRRRREHDVVTDVLAALPDPSPTAHDQLELDERHRVLWRHFQTLSDRCRALLRIVAMIDRPDYGEVSVALGMPRGSIGPTRARCLAQLRASLLADSAWSAG
jgi:RNA polymerase sigma factor (sigma-70 family)